MEIFDVIRKGIVNDELSFLVFTILCSLFIIDMVLYILIWVNLLYLNQQVKNGSIYREPMKSILTGFEELVNYSTHQVNTRAYVEDFFSRYSVSLIPVPLFDLFKVPAISTIKFIKSSVSLFILVGVLGTFVGIYSSLVNVLGNNQGEILTTLDSIAPVLSGMGTAFATSIVGMSFALLTSFILKLFNAEQFLIGITSRLENYLDNEFIISRKSFLARSFQNINQKIKQLNDNTENIYREIAGFAAFSSQFQEATEFMESFNNNLGASMEKLEDLYESNKKFAGQFQDDIDRLGSNIEELNNSLHEFSGALPKIHQGILSLQGIKEKTNTILEDMYRDNSENLTEIKEAFISDRKEERAKIDELGELVTEISTLEDRFNELLDSINGIREDFDNNLVQIQEEFKQGLDQYRNKYSTEMSRNVKTFVEHVDLSNKIINRGFDSIIEKFDNMDLILGKYLNGLAFNTNDLDNTLSQLTDVAKSLQSDLKKYSNAINKMQATRRQAAGTGEEGD